MPGYEGNVFCFKGFLEKNRKKYVERAEKNQNKKERNSKRHIKEIDRSYGGGKCRKEEDIDSNGVNWE